MKLLNHPNIVRLFDVFLAGNDGKMYLVTEFVSGGNLASTMKDNKLPRSGVKREVFTRMMIVSITSALDYMHSQNLAHRDLKPANVLVGPPVKLCDLGFSNDGSQLVTQTRHRRVHGARDCARRRQDAVQRQNRLLVARRDHVRADLEALRSAVCRPQLQCAGASHPTQ
jgi:serine/threonine protein kinase